MHQLISVKFIMLWLMFYLLGFWGCWLLELALLIVIDQHGGVTPKYSGAGIPKLWCLVSIAVWRDGMSYI